MLKNFKRILLVHCFDEFIRFLDWFFKAFLLNWFKNLRAQYGLYWKRAGVRTPWIPPLDARLVVLAKLVWSLTALAWPLVVLVVLVYSLIVLICPFTVLVCQLVVLICPFACPFAVLVCPFVVPVVLSVGLFITDLISISFLIKQFEDQIFLSSFFLIKVNKWFND